MYNSGWANLKPQESKYTPALALQAAKLLEAGTSLSATARELHVSRATLRNWRRLNPTLNQAFAVFEANKAKTAAHRLHVRKYKQVAEEIVEAARVGAVDPVGAGVKAQAETVIAEEDKPLSVEERRQQRLENWFNSDWTEELEAQQAQAEEERATAVEARRAAAAPHRPLTGTSRPAAYPAAAARARAPAARGPRRGTNVSPVRDATMQPATGEPSSH